MDENSIKYRRIMHHKQREYKEYLKLDERTRQGDPISAFLFILVLEIALKLIKENKNMHGLNFFCHTFFCTAYTNDSTFFLKQKESVKEVMNVFNTFSTCTGLKHNKFRCKIAGIVILRRVSMELCGMKCINLTKKISKNIWYSFFL